MLLERMVEQLAEGRVGPAWLPAAAPLAVGAVLEILRATAALPLAQGYKVLRGGTLPTYQTMLRSEDAAEGPRAFGEKRPPQWRGR